MDYVRHLRRIAVVVLKAKRRKHVGDYVVDPQKGKPCATNRGDHDGSLEVPWDLNNCIMY